MQTQSKDNLKAALIDFHNAYGELSKQWENFQDEFDLAAAYPFHESFDDLKVNEWIEASINAIDISIRKGNYVDRCVQVGILTNRKEKPFVVVDSTYGVFQLFANEFFTTAEEAQQFVKDNNMLRSTDNLNYWKLDEQSTKNLVPVLRDNWTMIGGNDKTALDGAGVDEYDGDDNLMYALISPLGYWIVLHASGKYSTTACQRSAYGTFDECVQLLQEELTENIEVEVHPTEEPLGEEREYSYNLPTASIWTNFECGTVTARNESIAREKAIATLSERFQAVNDALVHTDNTIGWSIEFDETQIEIKLKEVAKVN